MGTVKIEGKTVALDDEIIAAGKDAIKAALSIDFPGAENADIQVVERPGSPSVVTVSKRAQPKGQAGGGTYLSPEQARVADSLLRAPKYTNPAVSLAAEVISAEAAGDREFFERAVRRGLVERAISESNREGQSVADALLRLSQALPACSTVVPVGF